MLLDKGYSLLRDGKFMSASSAFKLALSGSHTDEIKADLNRGLGMSLYCLGSYEKSIKYLVSALDVTKEQQAYVMLAQAYLFTGNIQQAVSVSIEYRDYCINNKRCVYRDEIGRHVAHYGHYEIVTSYLLELSRYVLLNDFQILLLYTSSKETGGDVLTYAERELYARGLVSIQPKYANALSSLFASWEDIKSARYEEIFERDGALFYDNIPIFYSKVFDAVRIEGVPAEFGVYQGTFLRILAAYFKDDTVYGFDSFKGLPEDWEAVLPKGHFKLEQKPTFSEPNVRIIEGDFSETLPSFKSKIGRIPIRFAHIDCDLYSSTILVLRNLIGNIVSGSVLLFDEYYNYTGWESHEYKAFQEFLIESNLSYRYIAISGPMVAIQIL